MIPPIETKHQWTFFSPRPGEEYLGKAFVDLIDQLLKTSKGSVIEQLKIWLDSELERDAYRIAYKHAERKAAGSAVAPAFA